MDLTTAIILLFVGSAVFLTGMKLMSSGLQKSTGRGVKLLFKKTQNSRLAGVGIGAAVTALIQSSAATAVMAVGFINAGVMTVFQGLSVVLGAFLGTTITGVLVSLSSFSISTYLMLFSFVGVVMMFFNNKVIKNIGEIFAGLGILFFGLEALKQGFHYETITQFCSDMFEAVSFPPLLLLIGIIVTALVQSSSATTGIVIVMVGTGALSFEKGLYLAIGATIGTVITTILATIGGTANAKRTALLALFNRVAMGIVGTAVVWIAGPYISEFFMSVFGKDNLPMALAVFTIVYNLVSLAIFLPLLKPFVKLGERLIKDKDQEKLKAALKFIDDKMLGQPSVAMMQVTKEIEHMAELARINLGLGYQMMMDLDLSKAEELNDREAQIDYINNAITEFLIALSPKVDKDDEALIGGFFHVINDIERIGDHGANFLGLATRMKEDGLAFSDTARGEFAGMMDLVDHMYSLAMEAFADHNRVDLEQLTTLEEQSDRMKERLESAHYNRLKQQTCRVELSPFYSSLASELERVADHLTNIGYSFISPTGDDPGKRA